jgi:hypothetical protein
MGGTPTFDIVLDGAMVSLVLSKLAKLNILRSYSPLIEEGAPKAASLVDA